MKPENSLGIKDPILSSEWHPTRNGKLTPFMIPRSYREKVWWKCKNGHIFEKSFIRAKHCWCAKCSDKAKHTIEECFAFALNKGGKCLSTEYINCKTKMVWQCEQEHTWQAKFDDIKKWRILVSTLSN